MYNNTKFHYWENFSRRLCLPLGCTIFCMRINLILFDLIWCFYFQLFLLDCLVWFGSVGLGVCVCGCFSPFFLLLLFPFLVFCFHLIFIAIYFSSVDFCVCSLFIRRLFFEWAHRQFLWFICLIFPLFHDWQRDETCHVFGRIFFLCFLRFDQAQSEMKQRERYI